MTRCYRIVRPAFAPEALSGEGARLYGGRWNPPGWRCVYTAGSRALAVLEMLCHLPAAARTLEFRLIEIGLPNHLITPRAKVPPDWNQLPSSAGARAFGRHWLAAAQHAALAVPSVLVPEEDIFLLNPLAPGFDRVRILGQRRFALDERLALTATPPLNPNLPR